MLVSNGGDDVLITDICNDFNNFHKELDNLAGCRNKVSTLIPNNMNINIVRTTAGN